MLAHEYQQCEKRVLQLIEEAEEVGEHYSFDLRYERAFESLERSLGYLAEKHLLIDGERRQHQFYIYLKNSERMIELAQLRGGLSIDGQGLLSSMLKVNSCKNEKNYADLVSSMITLRDKIDSFLAGRGLTQAGEDGQPTEEEGDDIIAKQAMITLEEVVQELCADPEEIHKFAFELRKQDTGDKYSFDFLNGQVRPPVLIEMILANKWDSQAGKMTVEAKDEYAIMAGDKFLRYSSDDAQRQLQLSELESEAGYQAKFQLLLTQSGLLVGSAERTLVTRQHGLAEGGQQQLTWGE